MRRSTVRGGGEIEGRCFHGMLVGPRGDSFFLCPARVTIGDEGGIVRTPFATATLARREVEVTIRYLKHQVLFSFAELASNRLPMFVPFRSQALADELKRRGWRPVLNQRKGRPLSSRFGF